VTTLLVDPDRLAADRLEVRDAEHRHLFRARRMGPGERLRVVDGQGEARWGEVSSVDRHTAIVTLLEPAGLLASRRSPRRYGAGTLERLHRVARAALEQSERSRLPEITGPHEWEAVESLVTAEERWLLDPAAETRPLRCRPETRSAVLVIGPEGGFTAQERERLLQLGCRSRSLGRRVLRVETAAVVGAALLLTPGC